MRPLGRSVAPRAAVGVDRLALALATTSLRFEIKYNRGSEHLASGLTLYTILYVPALALTTSPAWYSVPTAYPSGHPPPLHFSGVGLGLGASVAAEPTHSLESLTHASDPWTEPGAYTAFLQ